MISRLAKNIAKNTPLIKNLAEKISKSMKSKGIFPPGHYYSPVPSVSELKKNESRIWRSELSQKIEGIDLNIAEQLQLFDEFKKYYKDLPFKENRSEHFRFHLNNDYYPYLDAICLYCMIRKTKPQQIIEVGSGYSSALMIDTNERYFNNQIKIKFIEPNPQRLLSLMKKKDKNQYIISPKNVQDCPIEGFFCLKENDILFIDSSHISKIDSDVNYILFEILPKLNKGVFIHFHDIFYPFEYPKEFIYNGMFFNENYLLRAFLEYNPAFKIAFFNTYLKLFFREKFEKEMPLCLKSIGGSIWIKKC